MTAPLLEASAQRWMQMRPVSQHRLHLSTLLGWLARKGSASSQHTAVLRCSTYHLKRCSFLTPVIVQTCLHNTRRLRLRQIAIVQAAWRSSAKQHSGTFFTMTRVLMLAQARHRYKLPHSAHNQVMYALHVVCMSLTLHAMAGMSTQR